MTREEDIKNLCLQVLNISPHYNSSSAINAKEKQCPFCNEEGYWNQDMDEIKHTGNCAYLIAKDLMTCSK